MAESHWTRRRLFGIGAAIPLAGATAPGLDTTGAAHRSPSSQDELVLDRALLLRFAEVVLPSELDTAARSSAVDAFTGWVRGYRAGAEMDHGYGFTRPRETDEHPAARYVADLTMLEGQAQERYGAGIGGLDTDQLRSLAESALANERTDATDLPQRPGAHHVLVALMTHWFRSADALDRCYGVRIRRETCRGLFTEMDGLEPLAGD